MDVVCFGRGSEFFPNHRTSYGVNNLQSGPGLFRVLAPTREKTILNFLIHIFPEKVQLLVSTHQMTVLSKGSAASLPSVYVGRSHFSA